MSEHPVPEDQQIPSDVVLPNPQGQPEDTVPVVEVTY